MPLILFPNLPHASAELLSGLLSYLLDCYTKARTCIAPQHWTKYTYHHLPVHCFLCCFVLRTKSSVHYFLSASERPLHLSELASSKLLLMLAFFGSHFSCWLIQHCILSIHCDFARCQVVWPFFRYLYEPLWRISNPPTVLAASLLDAPKYISPDQVNHYFYSCVFWNCTVTSCHFKSYSWVFCLFLSYHPFRLLLGNVL